MYNLKLLIKSLLLIAIALYLCIFVEANTINILDNEPIEHITNFICDEFSDPNWQIYRTDTIEKLVSYFEDEINLPEKLLPCRDKHLSELQQLNRLITFKNDDVCSGEKVNLIEEFHTKYVSKWPIDVKERRLWKWKAPKLLIKFFIHYAYRVSVVCKLSLIIRLYSGENQVALLLSEKRPELYETVDEVIKEFFKKNTFGSPEDIGAITLIWRLFDKNSPVIESEYFTKPSPYNGYKRATYASSDAEKVKRIQTECRDQLKPIYGSTLLSIIRLIDLGYYLEDESFAKHLESTSTLRRLIGTVLLCECILPISVVQDNSVKPGDLKIINRFRAKTYPMEKEDLKGSAKSSSQSIQPTTWQNTLVDSKTLPTVKPRNGNRITKNLKANIRKHERLHLRTLTDHIKSFFGKLFAHSSSRKPKAKTDFYPVDMLSLFELIV